MIDFYLKFKDEAEAASVLYDITPATDEAEAVLTAKYRNIDTLGILYEKQEIVDPENPPKPIPLEGWHVNVRLSGDENGEALETFSIVPANPRRVWA